MCAEYHTNMDLQGKIDQHILFGDERLTKDANISTQMLKDKFKIKQAYETGIMDAFDNPEYLNSDIMKSFFYIRSRMLYNFNYDSSEVDDAQNKLLWYRIKKDICDTFDVILNMRQDYLLKNFLKWFKNNLENFTKKCVENEKGDRTLKVTDVVTILEESVATIFPRVLNTGIAHIDMKNRDVNDDLYLPGETAHLSPEE